MALFTLNTRWGKVTPPALREMINMEYDGSVSAYPDISITRALNLTTYSSLLLLDQNDNESVWMIKHTSEIFIVPVPGNHSRETKSYDTIKEFLHDFPGEETLFPPMTFSARKIEKGRYFLIRHKEPYFTAFYINGELTPNVHISEQNKNKALYFLNKHFL